MTPNSVFYEESRFMTDVFDVILLRCTVCSNKVVHNGGFYLKGI